MSPAQHTTHGTHGHQGDMPPVTEAHRRRAYAIVNPKGLSYEQAMTHPHAWVTCRVIEVLAHKLRTDEWLRTQQRTVVPVKRCTPGLDGHPMRWATQMARGAWAPVQQPDLLN